MIQNHCVSIKQATVLFFSSFLLAACGEPQPRTSVREKGRLTVVMDEPLPGYFVFGGESYGYQYDLFKAFADHLGVELRSCGASALPSTTPCWPTVGRIS